MLLDGSRIKNPGVSSRPSGQQLRTPDGRKCWAGNGRWPLAERRYRHVSALETGMQCSDRYGRGARPFRHWWTVTTSLKRTRSGTSSQCSWSCSRSIWPSQRSNCRVPVITRAAAFNTRCSWCTGQGGVTVIHSRVSDGIDERGQRVGVQRPPDAPQLTKSVKSSPRRHERRDGRRSDPAKCRRRANERGCCWRRQYQHLISASGNCLSGLRSSDPSWRTADPSCLRWASIQWPMSSTQRSSWSADDAISSRRKCRYSCVSSA